MGIEILKRLLNMNYDAMDEYQKNIDLLFEDEDERLAGYPCPVCGYPVVVEFGLDVCYKCGWFKNE